MQLWQHIIEHIEQQSGQPFCFCQQRPLAGGSINSAFLLTGKTDRYFVKTSLPGRVSMFAAEARGLEELATSRTLRVPGPVCYGEDDTQSYLVLEYLDLDGHADQVQLGQQLAAMHRVKAARFGWAIDNTIGATHQPNTWQDNWLRFWRDQRLGFQLQLAAKNGYSGELQSLGERLLVDMDQLFAGRDVEASMLHGDLWGGNVGGLCDGTPVIYDPAFYYGDREADLAMTYVFGGFSADFYAAYQNAWPLDDGFEIRKTIYNVYHIINHLNMFGGGYHRQALQMMQSLLAALKS